MKFKICFLVLLSIMKSNFISAQPLPSMADSCNHWYVFDLMDSVGGSFFDDYPRDTIHYFIEGDTMIDGFLWKKFMREDSGYIGGIRAEGNSFELAFFYHKDSLRANLLYHFMECGFSGPCNFDSLYGTDKNSWMYIQNNGAFNFDTWANWSPIDIYTDAGTFFSNILLSQDTLFWENPIGCWVLGVGSIPQSMIWPQPSTLELCKAYSGPLIPMYHHSFYGGSRPQQYRQRLWKFVHCGTDSLVFDLNGYLQNPSAIHHTNLNPILEFSPNPATLLSCAKISNPFHSSGEIFIYLYNSAGQVVNRQIIPSGNDEVCIKREALPAGLYFYKAAFTSGEVAIGKIVFSSP